MSLKYATPCGVAGSQDFSTGLWELSAPAAAAGCVFRLKSHALHLDLTRGSSVRALGIPVSANPRTRGLNSPWQWGLLCICFGDGELVCLP